MSTMYKEIPGHVIIGILEALKLVDTSEEIGKFTVDPKKAADKNSLHVFPEDQRDPRPDRPYLFFDYNRNVPKPLHYATEVVVLRLRADLLECMKLDRSQFGAWNHEFIDLMKNKGYHISMLKTDPLFSAYRFFVETKQGLFLF